MGENASAVFCVMLFLTSCLVCTNGERTRDKIYTKINAASPCFRKLNATHQIGCSSERGGSIGVVHYAETKDNLLYAIEKGTAGPYVPVIPAILLTPEIAMLLKTTEKISGLVLFKGQEVPEFYSHEDTCPNRNSGLENTCKNDWNLQGTGLLHEDFHFPIFYLTNDEDLKNIKDCFEKFNNHSFEEQYTRSLCSIELSAFMYATTDTPTCIRRSNSVTNFNPLKFCDPLGDENVWGSLFPLANTSEVKLKSKMKYIVVTARLDSTSLFLDVVPGAANPITGMVALLSTARLLKKMLPAYQTNYDKNVLFFLLNGESYDYIGSQRMLYDMEKGEFPNLANTSADYPVNPIKVEDISLLIEFSQLEKTNKINIYHYKEVKEIRDFISKLQSTDKTIHFEETSGVLPPGSLQTFVKNNNDFPGLIIADHGENFKNKYYNAIYDNATNLDFVYYNETEEIPPESVQYFIANLSEVVAKSVYQEVTFNAYTGGEKASLKIINELFYCYLENGNCDVHKAIQRKKLREEPLSFYVSVSVTRNPITSLAGLTLGWFLADVYNETSSCPYGLKSHVYQYFNMSMDLTEINKTVCYRTVLNFTEAMSPAFLEENYDWKSGRYSSWSESSWQEVHSTIFLRPSSAHERMVLAVGFLVFILSTAIIYFVNSRSHILFPQPAEVAPTCC